MKKTITIILVVISLLMLLFVSGCGANAFKANKTTDSYNIELTADHNPLTTGENQLQIAISDKNGNAVTDAQVKINYSMAAMPGMPAMSHNTKATLNNKLYEADIDLMSAGSWTISVQITRDGKMQKADFAVDAH
ncbi:MAG: FixH family protein [Negativicutes bacterium]|jgi:hypothetical protein